MASLAGYRTTKQAQAVARHLPTIESVALAKAQQERDRAVYEAVTGIPISDEHPIVAEPRFVAHIEMDEVRKGITTKKGAAWIIGCPQPGCHHESSARTEARAVHYLSAHLVNAHDWRR